MKAYHGPQGRAWQSLLAPRSVWRAVWVAATLTVIVTVLSLSELNHLIQEANPGAGRLDWREVAGRAVKHAETLPHLPHLQLHSGADGGTGANAVAASVVDVVQQQQQTAIASAASVSSSSSSGGGGSSIVEEADVPAPPEECNAQENTELWGDVVKWGSNFKVNTPGECCDACLKALKPADGQQHGCNVWVWCGDRELCKGQYHECWLKYLLHPTATKPAREGPDVGWTSGIVGPDAAAAPAEEAAAAAAGAAPAGPPRKYHIVTSAQGSAVHWQVRVHYYWWKKQKHVCERKLGDRCEMGGFTRLLHSGQPDDLMGEVPTFVASPLPEAVVAHEWYPVLNRPWAFMQWIAQANISERYVLMSEPDHIFLRPLPNLMKGDTPAAFPFFYIEPHKPENIDEVRKFVPGGALTKAQAEEMAPIGNSPTFLTLEQMRQVMPLWANVSISVFKDKSASEKWGWVQEMYAFTISLWRVGVKKVDLILHLMAQPPWDTKMQLKGKPYHILHYTYGNDFDLRGAFTPGKFGRWRFDKRTYASKPPPRHLGEPPKGMKNDMVRKLVAAINEASANIPCWDEYAETGRRPEACGEQIPAQADGFKY